MSESSQAALLYGPEGHRLLAVTWTWTGFGMILYCLRAASAAREPSKDRFFGLRWDFIWVTLGFVATLTSQVVTTISFGHASSQEQDLETISAVIYTGTMASCAIIFGMTFGRIAVVALLLTIHGPAYRMGRLSLWAIAISQSVINIVQTALVVFQCNPVHRLWDLLAEGTCDLATVSRKFGFFSGSFGAFCDFYLAIYPALLIIGPLQQLKPQVKIALCVIMAGGVVAGIAGIIKTVKIGDIINVQFNYATVIMWTLTETWFIIIFGSITTTKAVFVQIGRHIKLFGTGFFGSARRAGHTDNTESMELSNRSTNEKSSFKKPLSRIKQERELDEDEMTLQGSFMSLHTHGSFVSRHTAHDVLR